MKLSGFDPDKDIASLTGKVIFITGGTGGIGRHTITELAKHSPSQIFFTGRNESAGNDIVSSAPTGVKITFLHCEPASIASVRQAADKFLADAKRLDVLIANLGILSEGGRGIDDITKDGYETHFGVNYLSNAAFLMAFLPLMVKTAEEVGSDVRYVSLTSQGAALCPRKGVVLETVKPAGDARPAALAAASSAGFQLGSWGWYGQSKIACVLLAKEVARRYPAMSSAAIHPGVVKTEFVTKLTLKNKLLVNVSQWWKGGLLSPREGSFNSLWAAVGKEFPGRVRGDANDEEGGKAKVAWYEPVGKAVNGVEQCFDRELGEKLWEWTVKELGVTL